MPHPVKPSRLLQMLKMQTQTIESETRELLEKWVMMRVDDTSRGFRSSMLLVKKKNAGTIW